MLLAYLIAHGFASAVVVVSPDGPIRTMGSGIAEARRLHSNNPAVVEIRVAPGSYRIESTIALTAEDSNLRIVGTGATMPRLIGGRRLMRWHPVRDASVLSRLTREARANVMECDLEGDDSIEDLGNLSERGFAHRTTDAGLELFFNGKPMQLARYPNAEGANGGWLRIATATGGNSITYSDSEPDRWVPSDDIWALGYWQFDWAESYEHVTRLNTTSKTLEFKSARFTYPPLAGRRFYFLNVLEELDEPGEWYLDRSGRRIYFWPPTPIEAGEAVASTLRGPMFNIRDASNLRIDGLDLESGRGGGVEILGGSQTWVQGCLIRNFGTFGISIWAARDSGVTGCDLTGLGEFGIALIGGERKTLTPTYLLAENNHIWAYSRWCRTYRPAVQLEGVGNRASHNLISDAPHQAILLSGNDHTIEFNDIANVCTETGDAGAIYMGRDPTMRGNQIRFNRFRDLSPKVSTQGNFTEVMGVYLDDCWAGTTVFGNVFDMRGDGIMLGGGRDNTIANNVFLDCHPAIHFDGRGKGWAAKYFVPQGGWAFFEKIAGVDPSHPPYSARYPRLANIQSQDVAFPAGNVIDSNVSLGGEWLRLLDNLTTRDFENHDNVVMPIAGTLAAALKYAPKSFQPIPVNKIGLLTKRRPYDRLKG